MIQQRRGRPSKTYHKVEVSNLQVEFVSKKRNDYGAEICYMKIVDKEGKKKMKSIGRVEVPGDVFISALKLDD